MIYWFCKEKVDVGHSRDCFESSDLLDIILSTGTQVPCHLPLNRGSTVINLFS